MKKTIIAAVMLIGAFQAKAQKVQVIPKAGINIAGQNISSISNEKSKVGFQGGLGFDFQLGKGGFSLMSELDFIGKGAKLPVNGTNRKVNLNYLELPVLAKYLFGPVYVNAGPSIGLLLNEKNANPTLGPLKKIDFGLQMGAGLAIPAGKGKFIVDGRYNLGLSNISDIAKIKNRGVAVSLGYAIPL